MNMPINIPVDELQNIIQNSFQELCPKLKLDDNTLNKLRDYIILLHKWNKIHNLVRYNSIEDLVVRHMLDSAQIYSLLLPHQSVVDFGSGAGFPGVILSLLGVQKVFLVESNSKKSTFLQHASMLSDNEVTVLNKRIENICDLKCDVVTSRALAKLSDLLQFSQNYLNDGGFCLFIKGENYQQEIEEAKRVWQFSYDNITSVTNPASKIIKINYPFSCNNTGT